MRTAQEVAMYVINKCYNEKCAISNLQLQKILYCLQVAFLKKYDTSCFEDDMIAEKYGAVVKNVYNKYCGYGSLKICENYDVGHLFNLEEQAVVDDIVETKRNMKIWDLIMETNEQGKAWDTIFNGGLGYKTIIPKTLMKENG